MKAKILILSSHDRLIGPMAAGWLKSFDSELFIVSAGMKAKGLVDPLAVDVMQQTGIDISAQIPNPVSEFLDLNWDYLLIINQCADDKYPLFTGNILHRVYMEFDAIESLKCMPEKLLESYQRVRDEIRFRLFDFYLRDLCGKEILGADSCGVSCDLP